jgi:hypothetical protein
MSETRIADVEAEQACELAVLLESLTGFLRRYVVLSQEQLRVLALWVVHTHVLAAAEVTPYLAVTSAVPGCGKTLLLEVLEPLVARPWKTGRVTPAVLMRRIDAETPTLLLDESDMAFRGDREYAAALQGTLNEGYRRRGNHTICVPRGNSWGYQTFSVFCAKAVAGIGKLPDTVASRSIPVELQRKTAAETVEEKWEERLWAQAEPLREALERFADDQLEALRQVRPRVPARLQNRQREVCRPLLAIAELAGEAWPERTADALLVLMAGKEIGEEAAGIELLAAIREVFAHTGWNEVLSQELIRQLARDDESAYADWWDEREAKPARGAARRLANSLRAFGIRSRNLRREGKGLKGYDRQQFEDAWARHLPATSDGAATAATTAQPRQLQTTACRDAPPSVAASSTAPNPHHKQDVAEVAASRPVRGHWRAPDLQVRQLLQRYRPELIRRNDITTPNERREIALHHLARERHGRAPVPPDPPADPRVADGNCDDCHRHGACYRYGRFALCGRCCDRRAKARPAA